MSGLEQNESSEQPSETGVARLEVRRQGEEEVWEDAGQISLLDDTAALKITPAENPRHVGIVQKSQIVRDIASRQKMLPRSVKLLLSPKARIKADRKANFLYRHSSDGIDTNLLILLHGAGDSHSPFNALAKRMELPQTASLSISASSCDRGFTTLPFGLGYTWFDEMDYSGSGDALPDSHPQRLRSLDKAVTRLADVVNTLSTDKGWHTERIFLFGFSAGACLAMETCLMLMNDGRRPLGGAICVAGGVKSNPQREVKRSPGTTVESTPILIVAGSSDEVFPPSSARRASKFYNEAFCSSGSAPSEMQSKHSPTVDIFIKDGKGHAMLGSHEEMRVVMQFLSQRLVQEMPRMEGLSDTRRGNT